MLRRTLTAVLFSCVSSGFVQADGLNINMALPGEKSAKPAFPKYLQKIDAKSLLTPTALQAVPPEPSPTSGTGYNQLIKDLALSRKGQIAKPAEPAFIPGSGTQVLLHPVAAPAETPEPPPYSSEDFKLLVHEWMMTHSGFVFEYSLTRFTDRETAEHCMKEWERNCLKLEHDRFSETRRSIELAPEVRQALTALDLSGDVDQTVLYLPKEERWYILEWVDTKFETLEEFSNSVNLKRWLPLFAPIALTDIEVLRKDPDRDKEFALFKSRTVDDLKAVDRQYHLTPADLDRAFPNGETPLMMAVSENSDTLVSALVRLGASVNHCSPTRCPLEAAILSNRPEMVRLLLDLGVNPETVAIPEISRRPISLAASISPEILKILLEHGVRPDTASNRKSPLMYAVSSNNADSFRLLLEAGADPLKTFDRTKYGLTKHNSLLAYLGTDAPAFDRQVEKTYADALEKNGQYEWDLWLEQDGRRIDPRAGETVRLLRKPFQVRMSMRSNLYVWATASLDPELDTLAEHRDLMASAMNPMRVGATSTDASYLAVEPLHVVTTESGRELDSDFSSMRWGFEENPEYGDGTRELPATGPVRQFVHDVTEILPGDGNKAIPIGDYHGEDIHLLVGVTTDLRGAYLYKPRQLVLHFVDAPPPSAKPSHKGKAPKHAAVRKT